jgi:hypothetical protein
MNIGRFDADLGVHDGPIGWNLRPGSASSSSAPGGQTAHDAKIDQAKHDLMTVALRKRKPFMKTALVAEASGTAAIKVVAFDKLVEAGRFDPVGTATVPWGKGSREVPTYTVRNTP